MLSIGKNVSLKKYTTLNVGGTAQELIIAEDKMMLLEALDYAYNNNLPFVVIGSGSNILISDRGFEGLVIINKSKNFEIKKGVIIADSGAMLSRVARASLDKNLLGMEFGCGIPGTIGGAISGNVGTIFGNVSDILVSAEVWHNGKLATLAGDNFDFDYRYSNIKGKNDYVVISGKFNLLSGDTTLAKENVKEDLVRRSRSYIGRTAGSYFKNPVNGKAAAFLIDSLGLKGYCIGGAEVSMEHANVLRNKGNAIAKDFYDLENHIVAQVKDKYGVTLEPEVIKIGKFNN